MLIVPLVAATLTRWLSAGVISGLGLLLAAAGLVWLDVALRGGAGPAAIGPMLAIGIGAGMPWGLMDGLSVSVVPKERAGMATGIFSTTRVAGEGIARSPARCWRRLRTPICGACRRAARLAHPMRRCARPRGSRPAISPARRPCCRASIARRCWRVICTRSTGCCSRSRW
jgi:hypothetical protein